ncbi:hypothetical protein ACFLXQ_02580 [Chloroflexota bacterium]
MSEQRVAEQGTTQRHQRRHEWRQIYIPKRQVPAHSDGIELISKKPIFGCIVQMKREFHYRTQYDNDHC